MLHPVTAATFLALLTSISSVASLPSSKLDDVQPGEGTIAPIDISNLKGGVYWYMYELQGSALPAKQGAAVTQYEMKDIISNLEIPVSGQAYGGSTILTGPITRTYTMDQGASTLHFSKAPAMITTAAVPLKISGVVRDCNLYVERGEGVCVEEIQRALLTTITKPTKTAMSTYTTTLTSTYTRPLQELMFKTGGSPSGVVPAVALSVAVYVGVAVGVLFL